MIDSSRHKTNVLEIVDFVDGRQSVFFLFVVRIDKKRLQFDFGQVIINVNWRSCARLVLRRDDALFTRPWFFIGSALMFLIESYGLAVAFCVVTMLCWGSWANTQKLVDKKWRYELFYWDYVFGVLAAALVFAYTLGSQEGALGRSFFDDMGQAFATSAGIKSVGWALAGGVVFNIANILLVSAIDIAGMAVAFPVGIGLALVLGVILNFCAKPEASGNPALLFLGVALVTVAIIISAASYGKRDKANVDPNAPKKPIGKGLVLSVLCGVLMSLFYYFVANSLAAVQVGDKTLPLTLANLNLQGAALEANKLTPYTANLFFAVGVLLSNCVIMPILMKHPFVGEPVQGDLYWKGSFGNHFWGWVGGIIWAIGMTLNVIASGVASAAVAYGLGQGATLMSAIWGVFIWREFKGAPKGVGKMLTAMFICFVVGLSLIILTKLDDGSANKSCEAAQCQAETSDSENVSVEPVASGESVVEASEADVPVEVPAVEESVVEVPAVETPAVEAPVVETPAVEVPAVETPAVEVPAVETPAVEVPAVETPAVEVPVVETPAVEVPVVETPAVEVPVVETPAVEVPVVETPVVEAPAVETPAVEAPVVETPVVEAPAVETPAVEAPVVETPVVEAPAVEIPAVEAPAIEAPAVEAPAIEIPAAEQPTVETPAN